MCERDARLVFRAYRDGIWFMFGAACPIRGKTFRIPVSYGFCVRDGTTAHPACKIATNVYCSSGGFETLIVLVVHHDLHPKSCPFLFVAKASKPDLVESPAGFRRMA